jgi:tyramine---L-glutamate ligase
MKILLAEYSVCSEDSKVRKEGMAMYLTLKRSFELAGCKVFSPADMEEDLDTLSKSCDCGLVIAPDCLLEKYTAIVEHNCINLGCPSSVVRLCADKLRTTEVLIHNCIPAPRIVEHDKIKCVVKPRYGCDSEGVFVSDGPVIRDDLISTEFINGEHLSVTLIGGKKMLPLTLNRQIIDMAGTVKYNGNEVPYDHSACNDIFKTACDAGEDLGCRGLFGVDIVYSDRPYVVDVNPRPTTAIVGVSKVIDCVLADLILKARFGELPESVKLNGKHFTFTKDDLEDLS